MRQPLFANAGYLIGVNLVGTVTGFVFWALAARLYQPEDVGTASAALSAIMLVSGIAGFGIGNGLVRFLPEARSPHRLLNTAFTFNGVTALLISGVFLAGLHLWSPSLIVLRQNGFYATAFLITATAATLVVVIHMAFVARRRAIYGLFQICVVNGGRLSLVVSLMGLGAVGLMGSLTVGTVGAVALSLWGFLPRVELGYRPRLDFSWSDLVTIVPYSIGNHIAGLLAQTSQMILPLLILEMLGPASSGHAYIAWMLGSLLTSPAMAVAGSAFAEGSNSPQQLTSILIRSAALGLSLTIPVAIVLGITAPWFLLVFGPSYAGEATGLLRWLSLAAPAAVLTGLYFTRLRVQKRIRRLILLSGVIAAATLGLAAALMPYWGIAASGIGWLSGNSLVTVIALVSTWRELSSTGRQSGPMSMAVAALNTLRRHSELKTDGEIHE